MNLPYILNVAIILLACLSTILLRRETFWHQPLYADCLPGDSLLPTTAESAATVFTAPR